MMPDMQPTVFVFRFSGPTDADAAAESNRISLQLSCLLMDHCLLIKLSFLGSFKTKYGMRFFFSFVLDQMRCLRLFRERERESSKRYITVIYWRDKKKNKKGTPPTRPINQRVVGVKC